jgi:hypothetical protein
MSIDDLRTQLLAADSLATAIRVGVATAPAWMVVDVVVQDEYTHDVIMQAAPDGPAIVLDCT